MIKSKGQSGTVSVTFTLAAAVGASHAAIGGEWNDWSPDRDVMEPAEGGGFTRTVELEPGWRYRFRYLLDGHRWENDWAADSYVPNDHGGDDSVVDLTVLAEEVPVASTETSVEASAKKAAAKKATVAKKVPTKKAAPAEKAASAQAAPAATAALAKKAEPDKAGEKAQPAKMTPAKKTTKKAAG
jgi:hypothetical protein